MDGTLVTPLTRVKYDDRYVGALSFQSSVGRYGDLEQEALPDARGRFLKKNSANAEFERRRRLGRWGVPSSPGERPPPQKNFSILDLKQVNFGAN